MRVVLDACVLYPPILRGLLLGVAETGYFTPLWSKRILGEWERAAERDGYGAQVRIEQALMTDRLRASLCETTPRDDLFLPDPNDVHVLETALSAEAEAILTLNLKDFPTKVLGRYGVLRFEPDGFLADFASYDRAEMMAVLDAVLNRSDTPELGAKKLLKKARLPRLAKRLEL